MTVTRRVVLDASIFIHALVDPEGSGAAHVAAVDRGAIRGHVPELAFWEVANALLGYVRAGALTRDDATSALEALYLLPLQFHGRELVVGALTRALERGLSAYDATYVVLAESLDATLVTADRQLAAATPNAELIL